MGSTLNEIITAWRTANQKGAGGLMSKLTIDNKLYDVKDPALDKLAEEVETRLSALESAETGGSAANTTFDNTSNGFTASDVQAAIEEVLIKVIGQSTDLSSADTINAAKKYAEELVNNLAGQDWAANAKKVQEIIAELENSDNANAWVTAIDKLAGLDIKYTQAEADTYNAGLTGAVAGGDNVPNDYETKVGTTAAGETLTEEEAKAYNATLEGAKTTSSVKTSKTVKQYVDEAIVNNTINATDLANKIGNIGNNTVKKYVDDNIQALTNEITDNELVVATALNNLNSDKADKSQFTTGTAHQVSVSYANENLTITTTPITVYVPVS